MISKIKTILGLIKIKIKNQTRKLQYKFISNGLGYSTSKRGYKKRFSSSPGTNSWIPQDSLIPLMTQFILNFLRNDRKKSRNNYMYNLVTFIISPQI